MKMEELSETFSKVMRMMMSNKKHFILKKSLFSTLLLVALLIFSCKEKKTVETKVEKKQQAATVISSNISVEEEEIEVEKSDLDYELVDENSFKKWQGEYLLEYKDYGGEGNSIVKAQIKLDNPDSNNLWIWWEAPNEKNSDTISVYGSFGTIDANNTKIKFLPEVTAGDDRGLDVHFYLYEINNTYYIKSQMIPSENGVIKKVPIQKIK